MTPGHIYIFVLTPGSIYRFVLTPGHINIFVLTLSLPSKSADPPSAILSTNSGMQLNSCPPRMENPNPRDPRGSST